RPQRTSHRVGRGLHLEPPREVPPVRLAAQRRQPADRAVDLHDARARGPVLDVLDEVGRQVRAIELSEEGDVGVARREHDGGHDPTPARPHPTTHPPASTTPRARPPATRTRSTDAPVRTSAPNARALRSSAAATAPIP